MIRQLLGSWLYAQARWWLALGAIGWGHGSRLMRWACRLWPRHPEACNWLRFIDAKEALRHGQPDRALPLLIEAERTLPVTLGIRAEVGLAQTMLGNWEHAITVLERAVKDEHTAQREDVWSSLAWAYLKTGRAPKAREVVLRAQEVEVQSARLMLLHRLATGVTLGSLPVGEISDLLGRLPEGAMMVLEYARQQAQQGRQRLARAAVTAFPQDEQPRAFAIIARASLNEDDADTAAWAAGELLNTGEESLAGEAALFRSEAALRRGDDQEALAQARRALELDGGSGRAHEELGRVLLLGGDWDGAVDAMIEALHTGQAGALAAGVAALAAIEVGDKDSARGVFLATRCGDGLACAMSHAAQARLLIGEGNLTAALGLAADALDELRDLPEWSRRPHLIARLARVLREVLQPVHDVGDDEQKAEAGKLLQRMEMLVSG